MPINILCYTLRIINKTTYPIEPKMLQINLLKKNQFSHFLHTLSNEGWIIEELYLQFLHNEFQNDFFIASIKNEVVGFISAIQKTQNLGIISNFIIIKKFRSLGYGKELFSYAQEHLKNHQITLECTKKQESFYTAFGFTTYYESTFYVYTVDNNFSENKNVSRYFDKEKISLTKEISYVRENKNTLFRAIYNKSNSSAYGLCTPYHNGYKVIIFAMLKEEVIAIFTSLLNTLKIGTKIYMQTTPLELSKLSAVKAFNMQEFSRAGVMYNKIIG